MYDCMAQNIKIYPKLQATRQHDPLFFWLAGTGVTVGATARSPVEDVAGLNSLWD